MLKFIEHEDSVTIKFNGDINFETVRQIESHVKDWKIPEHIKTLYLDLHNVRFIDSTGVGFLISWVHPLISRYQAEIIHASVPVKNILQICKLDTLLKIS
ncbi:STAS domain-containing protein [Aneurinibacillus sp. Ricciae_BoGa-3]|uniref:STAS domain-containing protein n=1 Tax=Aneurinibacillus sp. Ricciae_BoGa-3 TaxID=3022697 RepID=UPI00233FF246|nr:STAS domain-containing protein [Aneurinibacillus sp. Ricciae_BoGa-3]WCK55862.1 STAS domain-containing protein [Aneurinibacillus sp. Ricciae_BoGa-3]